MPRKLPWNYTNKVPYVPLFLSQSYSSCLRFLLLPAIRLKARRPSRPAFETNESAATLQSAGESGSRAARVARVGEGRLALQVLKEISSGDCAGPESKEWKLSYRSALHNLASSPIPIPISISIHKLLLFYSQPSQLDSRSVIA